MTRLSTPQPIIGTLNIGTVASPPPLSLEELVEMAEVTLAEGNGSQPLRPVKRSLEDWNTEVEQILSEHGMEE